MRKLLLVLLLAFIAEHTPWRLMALMSETFFTHPGLTRVVQANDRYWDVAVLKERIEYLGYPVTYVKELKAPVNPFEEVPVLGVTRKGEGTVSIMVEANLSWNARRAVLAHEGGHIFQSELYSYEESEAFAEAVASLMLHDGLREHARYLSNKKFALFTLILLDSTRIYRAAAVLEE